MDKKEFCQRISNIAIKSILYEVAATPKPGLVDRNNSGSHSDMDFFTFIDSASVLASYFYKCALVGSDFKDKDFRSLLKDIRPIGIKAETDMFHSTRGINTHKGIIFSAGVIAAASGNLYSEGKNIELVEILDRTRKITYGITDELKYIEDKENLTYGEELFIRYKSKGIRGEVEEGFPTVLKYSYPILESLVEEKKHSINDILVQTLFHLMSNTEDSNVLGRHGLDELEFTRASARQGLELGGMFTQEGRDFIEELDSIFIEKNISPGGSADLLAVTLMLYMIENGDKL